MRVRTASLAPAFAESSRQAELRAVSQIRAQWQPTPRYHASAVAVSREIDGNPPHRRHIPARHAHAEDRPAQDRPPPPPPPERLTGGERFRRKIQSDPVEALLSLNHMSRADLTSIVPKDLLTVLYFITKQVKPSSQLHAQLDPEQIATALQIVRALLHARPTLESSPHRDAGFGYTLRGKALRALLRTGVLFGARQFVVDLFAERMDEQAFSKRKVVDTDGLAVDLAATREWKLATSLFAGPSQLTPREVYTPRVVAISMSAHLCTNKPWEAVRLFELFESEKADRTVTAEARCALVRAYLLLGDISSAQEAVHAANRAGIETSAIQLAMLRGYRMLGYDADVEKRVRQDLDRMSLQPQPAVLNAFVWLRLDADDLEGAETILQELQVLAKDAPLDPETSLIAITIASRRGDAKRVRRVWQWLNSRPAVITDDAVAHLCRALGRLGCGDEAIELFRSAVRGEPSTWPLPAGFQPGIVTANAVLEVATRARKYRGLVDITQLMHDAGIEPDDRTLIQLLEFASRNLVSSPTSLSRFFEELLQCTHSASTVDQFNIVLARVLRVATRDPTLSEQLLSPSSGPTTDPASGIQLRGKVHRLLAEQIASLRASGQKSTGMSLSNRLIYDALALDGLWPVPAIQKTWQSFVLRGFRPTPKHYHSLLSAYVKIGAMEEAEDVLRLASQSAVSGLSDLEQRRMLTSLIQGWSNVGQIARAKECYERIRTIGTDAPALSAIIYAHLHCGHPGAAISIARKDLSKVEINEGVIATAAHAIRRANDVPGSIFFIANYTQREGRWRLTPRLLAVVRKSHSYLKKHRVGDDRVREALELAAKMIKDDEVSRPISIRRKPTLSSKNAARVANLLEAGRRDEVWSGKRVERRGERDQEVELHSDKAEKDKSIGDTTST